MNRQQYSSVVMSRDVPTCVPHHALLIHLRTYLQSIDLQEWKQRHFNSLLAVTRKSDLPWISEWHTSTYAAHMFFFCEKLAAEMVMTATRGIEQFPNGINQLVCHNSTTLPFIIQWVLSCFGRHTKSHTLLLPRLLVMVQITPMSWSSDGAPLREL